MNIFLARKFSIFLLLYNKLWLIIEFTLKNYTFFIMVFLWKFDFETNNEKFFCSWKKMPSLQFNPKNIVYNHRNNIFTIFRNCRNLGNFPQFWVLIFNKEPHNFKIPISPCSLGTRLLKTQNFEHTKFLDLKSIVELKWNYYLAFEICLKLRDFASFYFCDCRNEIIFMQLIFIFLYCVLKV